MYTYRLSLFTKGRRLKVSPAKSFNQRDLTRAYCPKPLRFCGYCLRYHPKPLRFCGYCLRYHPKPLRFCGYCLRYCPKILRFCGYCLRYCPKPLRFCGYCLRYHPKPLRFCGYYLRYHPKPQGICLSLFTKGRRLKVSLAKPFNQRDLTRAYHPKIVQFRQ
jgi:hypothetical protein